MFIHDWSTYLLCIVGIQTRMRVHFGIARLWVVLVNRERVRYAGNYKHFIDILISNKVSAISTSNLLNFVGDGLKILRHQLLKNKIDLPSWD